MTVDKKICFTSSTIRPTHRYTGNIYILISHITGFVDSETNMCLLMLAEIKRRELTTEIAVTGTVASRTCKQCKSNLWIDF